MSGRTLTPVTVLYDACVLYPAPLRDLLRWLALTDLFRARWTDRIHDEWIGAVLRERPELKMNLERTRAMMNAHVRDCLVTGYEPLIETLDLPDPDDRHVLAAAIAGRADFIITKNLSDFPAHRLAPFRVEAQHPDIFVRTPPPPLADGRGGRCLSVCLPAGRDDDPLPQRQRSAPRDIATDSVVRTM